MRNSFNFHDFDWILFGLVLLIAGIGILEIYSTTTLTPLAGQFQKQIYWLLLGCALTVIVSQLDYHLILAHIPWIYFLALFTLGAVLLVGPRLAGRSEEHTSELQSHVNLVCRLLLEK